jgi:glycosyltransferase involved in cell wall biosynthesis
MFVGPQGEPAPGVTYHTGISDEELASLYRRAWVYASPSTYEGFGLPYLEAMACGTAVVATPNPGSREVLEAGKYGLLVEDAAFAGAVMDVLGHPQRRHTMETMGLRRAHELSLDTMLDQYETLLGRLCNADGGSIVSA